MNMTDVVKLLSSLNVRGKPGPLGVSFSWYFERSNMGRTGEYHFRVQCGSGIAGRGDAWNVVTLPSGNALGPKTRRKSELRRQVLEAIVEGVRPEPPPGYTVYARWHTFRDTSSVQWFTRRLQAATRRLRRGLVQ